ncbi:zinc finger protein CONSTANS-LIKE 7 [Prunus yedoensis var. nudiflora]|uniref:Zinc finger protein CONSTANS-LIKE 7 n=1 Tax=Prunus yedoensis var. nudiflora TaxID=2094558 RepID=A0A314UUI7_PRUYE|nr:zinc finger protein CONSTANS-LIKE 7 [Prunus yedoensis var. nudiflora]
MRYHSFLLRSPKKEEQQVPDSINNSGEEFSDTTTTTTTTTTKLDDAFNTNGDDHVVDIMDDWERILGIEEEEDGKLPSENMYGGHKLNWDFMDWDDFPKGGEGEEIEQKVFQTADRCFFEDESYYERKVVKRESVAFWDEDDEKRVQLNLNLNYQEVLDAWSDRGPLWADDCSRSSMASNGNYMGEVPIMEDERTRREASVLRYKEKRQSRFFSKKIRYQVRKLNADKRPRLKGRFVKRV